jgi:hypothetical protein
MRIALILAGLLSFVHASAQEILAPPQTYVYSDTFAIHVKRIYSSLDLKVTVSSYYDDRFQELTTQDSIVVLPYFTVYDSEPALLVYAHQRAYRPLSLKELSYTKLIPLKKNDVLEAAILKAMDPTEQNLLELARKYEELNCFGNAMYAYYKLQRMGYPVHLKAFIIRNLSKRKRPNSVQR